MKVNWIKEKTNIEKLVNKSVSYEEIGRMYGVSGSAVKKAAIKLGIPITKRRNVNKTEHFNKGKKLIIRRCLNCGSVITKFGNSYKFCSLKCSVDYHKKQKIEEWLAHPERFNSESTYDFIRNYLIGIHSGKCQECGWRKENKYTHVVPLEIHHIDGDCTNNRIENLKLLCPNCHSLTNTFGSINQASKRYKLKSYKQRLSLERLANVINNLGNLEKEELTKLINN